MQRRLPMLVYALAWVGAAPSLAVAADSATSPVGVIDSRLHVRGSVATPWLEARAGHAVASSADESSVIDTATPIGAIIFFR